MPYGWKIERAGADITDQVARFVLTADRQQFCRELVIDFADASFFAGLDFSVLPSAPSIEVFTRTESAWVSQGTFFLERPAYRTDVDSEVVNGAWGRSAVAALARPLAPRIYKTWTATTTFFAICEELCDLCGLTWSAAYCDIDDFTVWGYAYQADGRYPADILADLAALAGAYLTTDRQDHVCIRQVDYDPSAADHTVADGDIQALDEQPEWPDFGNRIRISPAAGFAGYAMALTSGDPCLPADGSTRRRLVARVTDADGDPVDDVVVQWSTAASYASLDRSAGNTGELLITDEAVQASSYHVFETALPASEIVGVYAATDLSRASDLAAAGVSIAGAEVTLTGALTYCDQRLVVSYRVQGAALAWLTAGGTAEDIEVTAEIEGEQADVDLYIGNPCRCPLTIRVEALHRSIEIGQAARLLVYAEEAGGPVATGRKVYMQEVSAASRGTLSWNLARLGQVAVSNEATEAVNETASGNSVVHLRRFAAAVTSVKLADEDGNPTGADLAASVAGKVVTLDTRLATGIALVASYTAQGAAVNEFSGDELGTARIRAWLQSTSEEPVEDSTTVDVVDETEPYDDAPADWDPGDDGISYGGSGGMRSGSADPFDAAEDPGCRLSDGSLVQCGEGERCCWRGDEFGCFPSAECSNYVASDCFPADVSEDPDAAADRFDAALEAGCDCEEVCDREMSMFDTSQSYDDGSLRTVDEIVRQDHGLDPDTSPAAYWEKYGEIEAAARQDCIDACQCSGTINYTTLHMETDEEQSLSVSGGDVDADEYEWSASGGALSETTGLSTTFTAPSSITDCDGVTITVSCRGTVVDTITIVVNADTDEKYAMVWCVKVGVYPPYVCRKHYAYCDGSWVRSWDDLCGDIGGSAGTAYDGTQWVCQTSGYCTDCAADGYNESDWTDVRDQGGWTADTDDGCCPEEFEP